jgi:hypothetical protein
VSLDVDFLGFQGSGNGTPFFGDFLCFKSANLTGVLVSYPEWKNDSQANRPHSATRRFGWAEIALN